MKIGEPQKIIEVTPAVLPIPQRAEPLPNTPAKPDVPIPNKPVEVPA